MRIFSLLRHNPRSSRLSAVFVLYLLMATGLLPLCAFLAVAIVAWKTILYIRLGYKTTPDWISGLVTSIGMFVAGLLNGFKFMNQWF